MMNSKIKALKNQILFPATALNSCFHTHTPKINVNYSVHKAFTSRCLVAAFNGGRSLSSGFPNSSATATGFSVLTNATLNWINQPLSDTVTLRLLVLRQSVLAPNPLRLTASMFFFQLDTCGHSPYVTSSLTRGWVCRLQLQLYPSVQGGPDIPPGTEFPFRRLLLLAGLRSRYSNPPPHGRNQFLKVKVTLRLTVSQSVSQSVLVMTRYLLLFDSHGLDFVGRPLWRDSGCLLS
jgi:hypothetical protein